MDIRVGKYILRSDQYSMWIEEEYIKRKGDAKGEPATRRVAGYSSNFENLMRSFAENQARNNDAKTIGELLRILKQTVDDIEAFRTAAVKKDFKLIERMAEDGISS